MTAAEPVACCGLPFFLQGRVGQRLCIYHAAHGVALKEALLYVHPFGEEMNKSRRMAALQARMLARSGVAVLQIDLHGCGDSSGDFVEARWDTWCDDLALAHAWLAQAAGVPVSLWGLRLGALLALDYARTALLPIRRFILWQPVLDGSTFMTQFLRLRLASEMMEGARVPEDGIENSASGTTKRPEGMQTAGGTTGLREALRLGQRLEIAGYELAPDLADAIDAVDARSLAPGRAQAVEWFEINATEDRPVAPASMRVIAAWEHVGVPVHTHCVTGPAFWKSQEIVECMPLLAATTQAICLSAA